MKKSIIAAISGIIAISIQACTTTQTAVEKPLIGETKTASIQIHGGYGETFALRSDGSVWTWGGEGNAFLAPVRVLAEIDKSLVNLEDVVYVSDRAAVRSDGILLMWAGGPDNILRNYSKLANAAAISPGIGSFCMVLEKDGTVWAWGANDGGQLGNGTNTFSSDPVRVSLLESIVAISASTADTYKDGIYAYCLALKSDGSVWAWGSNRAGQLGDGSTKDRNTPYRIPSISNAVAVAAGGGPINGYSIVLKSDGTVWAWGINNEGQLGDGTYISRSIPGQVLSLKNIVAIAYGGWDHCLALESTGTVWAWGNNSTGELGDGTNENRNLPAAVTTLSDIVAIGAGYDHSCAASLDGTVWMWGRNEFGQLGDGTKLNKNIPVKIEFSLK